MKIKRTAIAFSARCPTAVHRRTRFFLPNRGRKRAVFCIILHGASRDPQQIYRCPSIEPKWRRRSEAARRQTVNITLQHSNNTVNIILRILYFSCTRRVTVRRYYGGNNNNSNNEKKQSDRVRVDHIAATDHRGLHAARLVIV